MRRFQLKEDDTKQDRSNITVVSIQMLEDQWFEWLQLSFVESVVFPPQRLS